MIPIMIDPRRDLVSFYHVTGNCICVYGAWSTTIPISSDGAVLYTLHVGSSGKFKFSFKINGVLQLVLFNAVSTSPATEVDLGIEVAPDSLVTVECQNLDNSACDCYVSMRYSNIDLYARFNEEFTDSLESKLDRVS